MSTPRVAPGRRREVGVVNWAIASVSGRVAKTKPPNLFLTLGRRPGLFRGWLMFAGRLMPGGKLARRETELVILRVAHLAQCSYEREHHDRLGERAGLSRVEITLTLDPPDAADWSAREHAILAAVDELGSHHDLTDETFAALRRHLSEAEIVELLMLVGHYQMLAQFITTLRIQPDTPRR